MRRAPFLIATAAASVLFLAACSDDDESDVVSTSSPPTAEATTPPAADSPASAETITEIVAGNPEFSTLLAAVEAAGLAETLSGDGPFTVFAPTDAAFAELPAGTRGHAASAGEQGPARRDPDLPRRAGRSHGGRRARRARCRQSTARRSPSRSTDKRWKSPMARATRPT